MKQTTTPAIKYIDGQPFVRVIDLGHQWHTNTSNILAIGKRHHVPEEQLRRIDGRVWCSFAGLRYRLTATSTKSRITRHIREFLDAQAEKPTAPATESKPTAKTAPNPGPTATDLGTAALIADARRTASKAIAKASDNKKRIEKLKKHMDAAESIVKSAANIAEKASEDVERVKTTAQHAADLAQENADTITVTSDRLSIRLDRLSEHVDHVEKDVISHRCDALQRIRQAERNQRDNTARIQTLEEYAHGLDWTLAAVALLGVVGHVIRLLRRR